MSARTAMAVRQDAPPTHWLPVIGLAGLGLAVDLLTPFLIWKGLLPEETRWLSHLSVVLLLGLATARILAFDQFPPALWLIVSASLVWSLVALNNGQGALPTAWGWWLLFQYPLVGLLFYIQPAWPPNLTRLLRGGGLALLAFEVVFQIIQYRLGQPTGDDLAGTFGYRGTGKLLLFNLFVLCQALGAWVVHKRLTWPLAALGLGIVSAILGELKLFLFAAPFLAAAAGALYVWRQRSLSRVLLLGGLMIAALAGFIQAYDRFNPSTRSASLLDFLSDPQALQRYMNVSDAKMDERGIYYNLGRGAALKVGWESIRGDAFTLLFGWGLGSRGESRTLGTSGAGLTSGTLGNTTGTSLLVFMQELGLVGLATLGAFFAWVALALLRQVRRRPTSPAVELRCALILYTLGWPVWLWYNTAWTLRASMLLYWAALGYVFSEQKWAETGAPGRPAQEPKP